MKSYSVTIQMKATKQYFSVVLFIMMYKVVQTFESMDGPLLLRNVKKIKTMVGHVMLWREKCLKASNWQLRKRQNRSKK